MKDSIEIRGGERHHLITRGERGLCLWRSPICELMGT